jgi:hypothetical protein
MIANIKNEIDLNDIILTPEYLINNINSFNVEIHLEGIEFIRLFKSYISTNLDIDLDELDVLVILDIKSNRIVLNLDELKERDTAEWVFLIDEFKIHFGRSVFDFNTCLSIPTVLRKILSDCSMYKWNDDSSIDITYLLEDLDSNKITQFNNI